MNNYEVSEFYRGIKTFNQKDYPKAHHIWEHSWMRLGKSGDRAYLKPFIMLLNRITLKSRLRRKR